MKTMKTVCKISATREIPEMVLSCDLPIFPCNGEIVQHVNLPWNRQIAALAICREIFKLQQRTKDANCTFDPSPASTRQTTNSSVNDFQIERFFAAPISMIRGLPPCADSNHVRRIVNWNDSASMIRRLPPYAVSNHVRRIVNWNDSASFPPRAERQIRQCKRFPDRNDLPPRLTAPRI